MPQTVLTLSEIREMRNGLIEKMINDFLRESADDCARAPDVKDPRKVVITITASPRCNDEKFLEEVQHEIHVSRGMPKRVATFKSHVKMNERHQREFVYESQAPDNPDQIGLPFEKEQASHE